MKPFWFVDGSTQSEEERNPQRLWLLLDPNGDWRLKLINAEKKIDVLTNLLNVISEHGHFEKMSSSLDGTQFARCADGTVWYRIPFGSFSHDWTQLTTPPEPVRMSPGEFEAKYGLSSFFDK